MIHVSLPINGGHRRPISRSDSLASAGKTATNNEIVNFLNDLKVKKYKYNIVVLIISLVFILKHKI